MELINNTEIKAFDDFAKNYDGQVKKICPPINKCKVFFSLSEDYIRCNESNRKNIEDTPMCYDFEGSTPNSVEIRVWIVINLKFCEELCFTQYEIMGAIAHEFGHMFNSFSTTKREGQEGEVYADQYASKFGLGNELLSALERMSKSNLFSHEVKDQIINRIFFLRNL